MDLQIAFNIAITLVGVLGGWVLKYVTDELKLLRNADAVMLDKIQRTEVLVAGQYVRNEALEKLSNALFTKLDRIEIKIDGKQDKV